MYPLISRYLRDKLIFNFTAKEQKYQHNFLYFLNQSLQNETILVRGTLIHPLYHLKFSWDE